MPAEIVLHPRDVRSVAVIGTGSVGAGWAALFLAHGMSVVAHDPAPNAEARARAFVTACWPALRDLGVAQVIEAPLDRIRFVRTAGEAARSADLVQENTPENRELKAEVMRELDAVATPDKVILSSTGGIPPTSLQAVCRHPERVVVLHPFNPSHLIPLVEVVGGKQTAPAVIDWAVEFSRHVGKQPIRLHREASGHMTNRLQFALVREAVSCLIDGVASARDIDAAVRYGLGPRWTLMGSLLTLHLAGGTGGMKGILEHAGRAIEEWWMPTMGLHLTPAVIERLIDAGVEVSEGRDIAEWIRWRDENLVDVLRLQHSSEAHEPRNEPHSEARN